MKEIEAVINGELIALNSLSPPVLSNEGRPWSGFLLLERSAYLDNHTVIRG
jgi:hypothetical protein